MPRVSREQMARNHARILDEASRLLRERGADAVSIPEVMAAAGLTPGGFYKHFASKDDLLAQAGAAAFDTRRAAMAELSGSGTDSFDRLLGTYLSVGHRDAPGQGCPAVALAADAAHRPTDDPLRSAYVDGVRAMVDSLSSRRTDAGGDEDHRHPLDEDLDPDALVEFATMVGAVALARATAGDDISERILGAAREHLVSSRRQAARGGTGRAP